MKKILRIYIPNRAKVSVGLSFWQRLWNPNLSDFVLRKAKEMGIEQAVALNVTAGYLKGKKLAYDIGEVTPKDFSVILELLDTNQNIAKYLEQFEIFFNECRVFILNIEER